MSEPVRIVHVSVEDYLAGERVADVRRAYIDGEHFAMTGASRAHNTIAVNLTRLIANHLDDGRCRLSTAGKKVRPEIGTRFYYPELVVHCNDAAEEPDEYDETRPTIVVEILSASTEQSDRREKRLAYQSMRSLLEYVLVAQDQREVTVYWRDGEGWVVETFPAGEQAGFDAIGLVIAIDEIYRGVAHEQGRTGTTA